MKSHSNSRQIPAATLRAGDRVKRDGRLCDVIADPFVNDAGETVVSLELFPHEVRRGEGRVKTIRTYPSAPFIAYQAVRCTFEPGTAVRFREGIKPRCAGITYVVEGAEFYDNASAAVTLTAPRSVVRMIHAEDVDKTPSRQRGRSAYVDELELAVASAERA